MQCLDDNEASEFVSGALIGMALTKVESHLAGCRDCRTLVAALAHPNDADSYADTRKHERITHDSVAGKRPTRTLAIGDRVGRYLVLSTLGAGGMGVVFSAYDPQLDRKVAIKLLRANLGGAAKEARTRLKREAQAIAQLNHPNVVGVYDVGTTDDDDVYIAMEFVEGDTLTTWLKRWPRTWREILDVFHQAARGLQAAHSVGLLHRDFKPDNVLVGGDGRVRVTDFGLARSVLEHDDTARPRPELAALNVALTATGTVLGTPRYMPPEQLTGPDIDARSDQFSFCVALYEALYGSHPLPGGTSVAMLETGARAAMPPEGMRIPASINKAVMRGLEKDRAKRFPTMAALVAELTPPIQRSPVKFVSLAIVGLLLVGGAAAAVFMSRPEPIDHLPVDPETKKKIEDLERRIQQIEIERNRLKETLLKKEADLVELQDVKKQLIEKDAEIYDLVDQMTELRKQVPRARPAAPTTPTAALTTAVESTTRDLEGCFEEWASRQGITPVNGKLQPIPERADMLVRLDVTPDGKGHSPKANGEDSPSLKLCVEEAVARAPYPSGTEVLDLSVAVSWTAPNRIATSVRIVGRRAAPSINLDLR